MLPVILGAIGFVALDEAKKRAEAKATAAKAQPAAAPVSDLSVVVGEPPQPIPTIDKQPPTAEQLEPEPDLIRYLRLVQENPRLVAPLTPEGQLRNKDICLGTLER